MHSLDRRHILRLLPLGITTLLVRPPAARAAEEGAKQTKPGFVALGDFTVNLPDGGSANYVVLGITVEAKPEAFEELKDLTPRLKDVVVRRLMAMAQTGMLQPGHTDPMMLKNSLFDSLSELRPDGIKEVLITHLLYG